MRNAPRFRIVWPLICSLVLGCGAAFAADLEGHPLITAYPESKLSRAERFDFDAYKLVTDVEDGQLVAEQLEGKITRLGYYQPSGRSVLEIFRNYESALTEAGMEAIFTCAGTECGNVSWKTFNGITTKSGNDCRYLAGKLVTAESTAYVAIMVGSHRHQIDIVEVKEMETGLVKVDAEALAKGIEREGRVSVYGIYFDTGKATLKSESKPALDEIAKLMAKMADLKIYVVGHTDSTGTLALNMSLSQERARSVVKALSADYGIAAARMSGHGVGPLCPASTNRSDPGRAKNRRVDLVEQ